MTAPAGDVFAADPAPGSGPRRGLRWWIIRLAVASVLIVVAVLAYQVTRTGLALRSAAADARVLRTQLGESDVDAARRTATSLREHASTARRSSDGWLWATSTLLPIVGDDARAVRQVAAAVDLLAAGGLEPGLDVVEQGLTGRLKRADGGFDVQVIASLQGPLRSMSRAAARADGELVDVDPGSLVGPLREPVADVRRQLSRLDRSSHAAVYAAELLPGMLGGEGVRRYLFVVQNNAEVRATGGLPGSISVLRVAGGRLELEPQGSAASFSTGPPDAVRLAAGEKKLLGATIATDFRDSNSTPDFPRAAEIMTRLAERRIGQRLDGVVAIDPVTLARVLGATGPLRVAGQPLDAGNAVSKLLFDPYQELLTNAAQDEFFAEASDRIFDALLGDAVDERVLIEQLAGGVSQRRVLVWSSDDAEQQRLQRAGIAGGLSHDTGSQPEVGFYLNDAVGFKIDYFLRHRSRVVSLGCTPDGRQVVQARMQLSSEVPTPVSQLTEFVTGRGEFAPPGVIAVNMAMYGPTGGELTALQLDGLATEVAQGQIDGRQVSVLPLTLEPGQSAEVVANFTTRPGQDGAPRMEWTPGIEWGPTHDVVASACA